MINYSHYKRFYADPGLFYTLTGDYTGYVEVLSGVPYIDNTTNKLFLSSTFETSLATSIFFKNRTILDVVDTLPYTERDVLFQANDFLTERLFKDKLTKLHDNNTFIYSRLFIANNDLPYNNEIMYGYVGNRNSTSLSLSTGYTGSIPFRQNTTENIKALGNIINFKALKKEENQDEFVIFAITSNQFISLTGNNTNINIIEVSKYYESEENVLPFSSLGGIAIGGNYVFITDTGSNTVVKYDIAGYLNGDSALGNKRNLIEILGGDGPNKLKTKFKQPKEITSNGKLVVIHDSGNTVLKIFDTKFNYHSRVTTIPLKKQPLASIQFNPYYNLLYALTYDQSNTKLNLYIYDLAAEDKRPVMVDKVLDIGITLTQGELVQNIEFSKNSSEYYYICTNKNSYKLYITLPNTVIGRYQETKLFNTETSTVNDTRVVTLTTAPIITITPPVTFTTTTVTLCSTPDTITTQDQVISIPQIKDVRPNTFIFNPSSSKTTPGYSYRNNIMVNASNRWSVVPINFKNSNWVWEGTYQVPDFEIIEVPPVTTFYPATTTIVAGLTTITPPTTLTAPATITVIPSQNFTKIQEQTTTIPGLTSYEPGEPYEAVVTTTREVETLSMFNDNYRGLSILPSSKDVDKIIFITDARIYFYEEPNKFKKIIKHNNLQNYGIANISTVSEEYIQASTINKELYKITRDIFAIKNNLVGRFNGFYDSNQIFILNDYNYNIDFNNFIVQEEEDYSVHENERTILGVMNRALVNILKLQENLLEFTIPDTGSDLRPVFNPGITNTKALIID